MRIAPGVEALELTMGAMAADRVIHPVVLWDDGGATLVDTGAPGQVDELEGALRRLGLGLGDIRRVILTHQDMDHIGNAAEVVRRSGGAEVLAHADDVPYIQGERQPIKFPPERVELIVNSQPESRREAVARLFSPLPTAKVDRTLADGEVLPIHGGIRVVHTPGHTPGHVSLFLEAIGWLIAADAVRVEDGVLLGPNPVNTPDMPLALRSVGKLGELPVEHVHCHHGGPYGPGAARRLQEIARGQA